MWPIEILEIALQKEGKDPVRIQEMEDSFFGIPHYYVAYTDKEAEYYAIGTVIDSTAAAKKALFEESVSTVTPKLIAQYTGLDSTEGEKTLVAILRNMGEKGAHRILRKLITDDENFAQESIEIHGRAHFLACNEIEIRERKYCIYRTG